MRSSISRCDTRHLLLPPTLYALPHSRYNFSSISRHDTYHPPLTQRHSANPLCPSTLIAIPFRKRCIISIPVFYLPCVLLLGTWYLHSVDYRVLALFVVVYMSTEFSLSAAVLHFVRNPVSCIQRYCSLHEMKNVSTRWGIGTAVDRWL